MAPPLSPLGRSVLGLLTLLALGARPWSPCGPTAASAAALASPRAGGRGERGGVGRGGGVGGRRVLKVPKKKPPPPSYITTPECDLLNRALLTSYFRPDLGSGGVSFTRPLPALRCARSLDYSFVGGMGGGSFEYNPARDAGGIARYFRHFYSLYHPAKRSPVPEIPSKIDIIDELTKVAKKDWNCTEDFYVALTKAVDKLSDAHTRLSYRSNVPASYWFPLPLVGLVEDGVPVVRVAPASLTEPVITEAATKKPFEFNASQYFDAKVMSIDGAPAWKYMVARATNDPSTFRTVGQRLNDAFSRFIWTDFRQSYYVGSFAARRLNPGADYLQMVLQRPGSTEAEEVSVPWLASISGFNFPFKRTKRAQGTGGVPSGPPQDLPSNERLPLDPPVPRPRPRPSAKRSTTATLARAAAPSVAAGKAVRISGINDLWPVYKLDDGKTAIVAITTFSFGSLRGFMIETVRAFETVDSAKCTQVILDVRSNPGGYLENVMILMEILLGTDATNKKGFVLDEWDRFRADTKIPLLLVKAQSSFWNWEGLADGQEVAFTKNTSSQFFFPLQTLKLGPNGSKGRYSSGFKTTRYSVEQFLGKPVKSALAGKKVAILSDGHCFSACGSFTVAMRGRFNVKFVTIGGIPNAPLQVMGGAGSAVSSDVAFQIASLFPSSVSSRDDAPPPFFTGPLQLSMPYILAFTNNTGNPIDFQYLPSDLSLNYTRESIADPFMVYPDAAKVFK